MSERLWQYEKGQQKIGPIPESHLRALLQTGDITPETPVWTETLPVWVPAGEVEVLRSAPAADEPTAPAPLPAEPPAPAPGQIRLKREIRLKDAPAPPAVFDAKVAPRVDEPIKKSESPIPSAPAAGPASYPPAPHNIEIPTKPPPPAADEPGSFQAKPKKIAVKASSPSDHSPTSGPVPAFAQAYAPLPKEALRRDMMSADRPWWISLVCGVGFLGSGLMVLAFFVPDIEALFAKHLGKDAAPYIAGIGLVNLIGLSALWRMQRWGLYLCVPTAAFGLWHAHSQGIPLEHPANIVVIVIIVTLVLGWRDMS